MPNPIQPLLPTCLLTHPNPQAATSGHGQFSVRQIRGALETLLSQTASPPPLPHGTTLCTPEKQSLSQKSK